MAETERYTMNGKTYEREGDTVYEVTPKETTWGDIAFTVLFPVAAVAKELLTDSTEERRVVGKIERK